MAYTIGSSMTGTTWSMKTVSGKIVDIHPGLGFTVMKDLYYYLIVDNFSVGEKPFNHHIEGSPPEYMNISLSKATTMFWLKTDVAKSAIYGKEIRTKQLIDPMSREGLILGFKVAPLIKPMLLKGDEDFYLKFGTFPGDSDYGNAAPLPYTSYMIQEEKRQMDEWHLARAKLQDTLEGNYSYRFLDCGHKLRVELNGQKVSLIHFNHFGIHKTPHSSPALTFTLKALPDDFGLETTRTYNLTNLTNSAIHQGIEDAHWEQARIRATTHSWATDPVYKNSMEWVDAAWNEIQARREEEGVASLSADVDAV